MRKQLCDALVARSARPEMVFLTGDLGFMALEPLREALGGRFFNAGVAEQNMVTVAAGVASLGEQCWTYSIAPFMYARPFQQIRNDVCLHDFDVKMVGNGGGYGYGVMGATHHAIEDYGVLLTLQNMRVYVPAFGEDLAPMVGRMQGDRHPSYLRLGRDEKPRDFDTGAYAPWRRLLEGERGVLVGIGPNIGTVLGPFAARSAADRPEVWVVSELPLEQYPMPDACRQRIVETGALFVLEEHVPQGSLGQMLSHELMTQGSAPPIFRHFAAKGYVSGRYGSQNYHRAECGIDGRAVIAEIDRLIPRP
jgi:transketolase